VTYRCFVGHLKDSGASRHDKPASNFLGFVSSCLCSGQLSFVLSYSVIISFPGPVELKLTFVEAVPQMAPMLVALWGPAESRQDAMMHASASYYAPVNCGSSYPQVVLVGGRDLW